MFVCQLICQSWLFGHGLRAKFVLSWAEAVDRGLLAWVIACLGGWVQLAYAAGTFSCIIATLKAAEPVFQQERRLVDR